MKNIIFIVSIFLTYILIINNSFAFNKCSAPKLDYHTYYTCLKENTKNKKNSLGLFEGMFGKTKTAIIFLKNDDIKKITINLSNKIKSTCIIKNDDLNKFIEILDKWANGKVSSNDMSFAKCHNNIIGSIDKKEIDLPSYKKIGDNFYKKNGKYFIFHKKQVGRKINGKESQDLMCEINGSKGTAFKKIDSYIFDNKNGVFIEKDNNYNMTCNIKKISNINYDFKSLTLLAKLHFGNYLIKDNNNVFILNRMDNTIKKIRFNGNVKNLENIGGSYFKYLTGIYYYNTNKGFIRLKNVDTDTFKVTDGYLEEAEDKNNIYSRGKFKEKKVKLIHKDNISMKDFKIINEKIYKNNNNKGILELTITTNVDKNLIAVVEYTDGLTYYDFKNGETSIIKNFDLNKNIIIIKINIYDNGNNKDTFYRGKLIGTIEKYIKFDNKTSLPKIINTRIIDPSDIIKYLDKSKEKKYERLIRKKLIKRINKLSISRKFNLIKKTTSMIYDIMYSKKYTDKQKIIRITMLIAFQNSLLKK